MGKALAALAILAAIAAPAYGEDLAQCNAGLALRQKAVEAKSSAAFTREMSAARADFKLCLARGKLTPANAAAAHLNLSAIAYRARNWNEVVSEYDLAAKIGAASFKPDAVPLYYRAMALVGLRRLKDARESFDQAVALAPKNWDILLDRLNLLVVMGDADGALADGAKLVASGDANAEIVGHMRRAQILASQKKTGDALSEINAAIALAPKKPELLVGRLNLYLEMQQPENALKDAADLAALTDPAWAVRGHMVRADILHKLKRDDEALAEIDAALKAAPNDQGLMTSRLAFLDAIGKHEQALADANTLVASAEKSAQMAGHVYRNVVFDREQRYGDALAEASALVKIDPKDSTGYNNLCMAQAHLGHGAEAVATCRKAMALSPRAPQIWNSMGFALETSGRLKEAVDYYKKVAAAVPDDAQNRADLERAQAALTAQPAPPAAKRAKQTTRRAPQRAHELILPGSPGGQ